MAGRNRSILVVLVVLAVVGGLLGSIGSAGAVVTATTGQLVKISPPSDVLQSGLCSPDKVFTFDEQQGVTLGADVRVDYNAPGSYTAYASGNGLPVPAGTVVDSHFLDSNLYTCNGQAGATPNREGTWKFSQDIVGVIVARPRLTNSDYLGSSTTQYPGSVPSREFDFGSGTSADFVQIVDARTIYVRLQTPSGTTQGDQMRVLTKHNSAPVVSAGGPYAGTEGSSLALGATATDPDSDPMTISWSFVKSAAPGTTCTYGATTTLTPTINCNDDALITATLSVTDGFHPAVTSVANVNIANRPPVIGAVTVPSSGVALGASVPVSATFSDPGTHDTHTATINWGDTSSSAATVNESGHTVGGSHVYSAPGLYTPTVIVNDDDGGTDSANGNPINVVGPPTANAGGPYSVDEGSTATLVGSATGHTPLTTTWGFVPGVSDAGTACTYGATSTLSPTVSCNDDLVIGSTLTVDDGINAAAVSSTDVTVNNVAPTLAALTATTGPIVAGQSVTVGGSFTDPGTNDTHTSSYDWGDLSTTTGTVSESGGSGSVSASHVYSTPGDYTVSVDVSDGDGGVDTRTIHIHVNTPPTATAGGTYSGPEGSTLTLNGTAGDVDGDPLAISWNLTATPAVCSFGATNTLQPTVLCTDDAVVHGTLSVSDGVNGAVTSSTTVNVGNVAPNVGSTTTTASPVGVGATVNASAPFTDVGTSDTHTATISWGDGTTSAVVSESSGAGTASGTHAYATAGSYQVAITVTDDDGDSSTTAAVTVTVNAPPTASAGGPYTTAEGSSVTLAGSVTDPESGPVTQSWSFTPVADPGTTCTETGVATLTPTVTCNDNAIVTATLTASDGINPPVPSASTTVTFGNLAPTIGTVTATPSIVAIGSSVSVAASFADAGTNDTHTATVAWGDASSSAGAVTESAGSGSVTASHSYSASDIYTVTVTVTDDNGGSASKTTSVVVYDPTGPFVTANGNFASPSGAYTPDNPNDPNLTGPAHIDFVSRYQHGDTVPSGHGAFRFNAADLTMNATGFDWLVVTATGNEAFFTGTGTVNDVPGYQFLVSAIDGSPDLVRIKVWQTSSGTVVYDNEAGAADDADPTSPITGGSVIIH